MDADVLYGIEATDLLLTLAVRRAIRIHWSSEILAEVSRNLAKRHDLNAKAIAYRIERMNAALPDARVEPPPELVDQMPVNTKDRHVLALASYVEANVLVTNNLRDFPVEACAAYAVEPVAPDDFFTQIARNRPGDLNATLTEISARRRNPALAVNQLVDQMAKRWPKFAAVAKEIQPSPAQRSQRRDPYPGLDQ